MDNLNQQIFESSTDASGNLNEQKLFAQLNGMGNVTPTKSVPTPFAQTKPLCGPGSKIGQLMKTVQAQLETMRKKNPTLWAIAELQFMYGLRISEVLDIRGTDIIKPNQVLIKGKKGSQNRIVNLGESKDYYLRYADRPRLIFDCISRFYVYREYKKLGISHKFSARSKESVTHLFRHLVVKNFKNYNISTNDSKNFIGHKAKASTEVYEK